MIITTFVGEMKLKFFAVDFQLNIFVLKFQKLNTYTRISDPGIHPEP